jgi:hypothetical protein
VGGPRQLEQTHDERRAALEMFYLASQGYTDIDVIRDSNGSVRVCAMAR